MAVGAHIPRVFVADSLRVGDEYALPEPKRHHLATVLRLGVDAPITLFNGNGCEYAGRISRAERKTMTVRVETVFEPRRESPLAVTLIQGVARGDRMDFAIAKAVELGVTRIRPVLTARGQVKLAGARAEKKHGHWQAVAEAAAEQSGRLTRPAVDPARDLACVLADSSSAAGNKTAVRLILAPAGNGKLRDHARPERVELLVGPESGFAEAEIESAARHGWAALSLGPRVLRTETAGIAALAAMQTLWGDFGY